MLERERYRWGQQLPPDETRIMELGEHIKDAFTALKSVPWNWYQEVPEVAMGMARTICESIYEIDQRDMDLDPRVVEGLQTVGRNDLFYNAFGEILGTQDKEGNPEGLLKLIRVGHLMGYTEQLSLADLVKDKSIFSPLYHPLKALDWVLDRLMGEQPNPRINRESFDRIFQEHTYLMSLTRADNQVEADLRNFPKIAD